MNRRIILWAAALFLVILITIFGIEEIRTFVIAFLLRLILFVKKNLLAMLAAFFLVKGKFILKIFLKKLAIISATGLGKRYVVEKVLMNNVKTHFLDHLADDIKKVVRHAKKNFQNFSLMKKSITVLAFLGSIGYIAKFTGTMIAVKVFLAKVWSFLLALFLKVTTALTYFFTDYLWGSWLAPIVEVVLFTWMLSWMEKVPFLAKGLRKVYDFFIFWFGWLEYYIEKVLHIPLKSFLRWLVKKIKRSIDVFIGSEHVSAWKMLKQKRAHIPNMYTQLQYKRKSSVEKRKTRNYHSPRELILQGRKTKNK